MTDELDDVDLLLCREFQNDGTLRLTLQLAPDENGLRQWQVIGPDWNARIAPGCILHRKYYKLADVLERAEFGIPQLSTDDENV